MNYPGGQHHVEHVMGMGVSIDVRDQTVAPGAIDDVVQWLHHVDATFSTHDETSPISRIGRYELPVDDAGAEIAGVLRTCEQIRVETGGAFDVFTVPAPNGTNFDPSGYVKGWAVEAAAKILESHGLEHFCVNAGGDIAIRGMASASDRWRVGVDHPYEKHSIAVVLDVEGPLAVATSATYARGDHIVDPATGRPVGSLASATVVGPDLGLADAYATTVFVLGAEQGLTWIRTRSGYEAYVITLDHNTIWTEGFNAYLMGQPAGAPWK